MKLESEIERGIYSAAFALRLHMLTHAGYPEEWRVEDFHARRDARVKEWEAWCRGEAMGFAVGAVEAHRKVNN